MEALVSLVLGLQDGYDLDELLSGSSIPAYFLELGGHGFRATVPDRCRLAPLFAICLQSLIIQLARRSASEDALGVTDHRLPELVEPALTVEFCAGSVRDPEYWRGYGPVAPHSE
jgi:hypothetical protein